MNLCLITSHDHKHLTWVACEGSSFSDVPHASQSLEWNRTESSVVHKAQCATKTKLMERRKLRLQPVC